jgi:hypothetical protein
MREPDADEIRADRAEKRARRKVCFECGASGGMHYGNCPNGPEDYDLGGADDNAEA